MTFFKFHKLFLVFIVHYSYSCDDRLQFGKAEKDVGGGHDGFVPEKQTVVELIQLSAAQHLRALWLLFRLPRLGFSAFKSIQAHSYLIHSILSHSLWVTSSKQKLNWSGEEQQSMVGMGGIMLFTHQWSLLSLRPPSKEDEDDDHRGEIGRIMKMASSHRRN